MDSPSHIGGDSMVGSTTLPVREQGRDTVRAGPFLSTDHLSFSSKGGKQEECSQTPREDMEQPEFPVRHRKSRDSLLSSTGSAE